MLRFYESAKLVIYLLTGKKSDMISLIKNDGISESCPAVNYRIRTNEIFLTYRRALPILSQRLPCSYFALPCKHR
jgi:hypothetical protein